MKNIFRNVKFIGDDEVVMENSRNKEEGYTITFTKKDNVPESFKATVLKLIESIESQCKLKKVGVADAYSSLGNLAVKLGNYKKLIKDKSVTNIYKIDIPYKVIQSSGTDLSGDEFIENIIKTNGFKKGGYTDTGDKNRVYKYYKVEKDNIYVINYCHLRNSINIDCSCLNNDDEGLRYLKTNNAYPLNANT